MSHARRILGAIVIGISIPFDLVALSPGGAVITVGHRVERINRG